MELNPNLDLDDYWKELYIAANDQDSWGILCFQNKSACPVRVLKNSESHSYVIGKDEKRCDIVLKDTDFDRKFVWISRIQLSISKAKLENGLEYVILKSHGKNGNFINGRHLKSNETCILDDGDIIWMAATTGNCCTIIVFKNRKEGQIVSDSLPLILKNDFVNLKTLGEGSFGKVILTLEKRTGEPFAMKISGRDVEHPKKTGSNTLKSILKVGLNDYQILHKIKHPNIIRTSVFKNIGSSLYMTMEYAPYGDLSEKLHNEKEFSESTNKHVSQQLLQALHFLHSTCKIAHRDFKPKNILVKTSGPRPHVLLTDFGLSVVMSSEKLQAKSRFGSLGYMAPEIMALKIRGSSTYYSVNVDIWSFGVTLYECTFGKHPLHGFSKETLLQRYMDLPFHMPSSVYGHTHVIKMINDSMTHDMDQRASAEKLLESEWFIDTTGK